MADRPARATRPWIGGAAPAAALTVTFFLIPRDAHAYTDPGSGLLLWQLATAAVFGALFSARRMMAWLKSRVRRRGRDDPRV